ncbi:hypothetical protein [Roseofilum sp. Belize Diploria]|uniref:hypothetical protein n=1 Tax=Roseofilum sp. Belize Diploria TaxID=2821501 RepID=UPI001B1C8B18|nr:hypothetical protein [Roseofilum sp. Belize Diploria]MBP0008049.1 hypothetical protein [Roseofilum sp. Belize Diploria]
MARSRRLELKASSLSSTAVNMMGSTPGKWEGFGVSGNLLSGMKNFVDCSRSTMNENIPKIWEALVTASQVERVAEAAEQAAQDTRETWEIIRNEGILNWIGRQIRKLGQATLKLGHDILYWAAVQNDRFWKWAWDNTLGRLTRNQIIWLCAGGIIVGAAGLIVGGVVGAIGLTGIWAWASGITASIFVASMLPTIASWVVDKVQEVWHFDMNVTDEELERQVQAAWDSIYGILGDNAGNLVGTVCAAIPGMVTVVVDRRQLSKMKDMVGDVAYDKLLDSFNSILGWSKRVFGAAVFAWAFSNGRKLIKDIVRGNEAIRSLLPDEWVKGITETWGEKGSKPWTFAQAFEEGIESIQSDKWRQFFENFFESLFESCGESFMMWADSAAY